MNNNSRFIVVDHMAQRAGKHQDLRFKMPGSKNWASFAVRKGVPLDPGVRVLASRTHDHSEEEALFLGEIPAGEYGAGILKKFDDGTCKILKMTSPHIVVDFNGKKVRGIYHLVNIGVAKGTYKEKSYLLFKSKEKT
jgi:bifunctional non-homologous end joining protein LigD